MFRPKRKWKKQRDRWHMRLLRRLYLSKRFCSICEQPRYSQPQPRELEQFPKGSATALVFQTKRFGRRQLFVRIGRWSGVSKGMILFDLLEEDDLDDAIEALSQARSFVRSRSRKRRAT